MSNQYLSFDVTKQSTPQQLITGRQGDSQLKFISVLLWDGEKNIPYDLTGKQVAFESLKPDNNHIVDYEGITILDAPHGLFRYSFNEQVFAVAGKMQQAFFKITHTDKDNQVITDSTLELAINILENRVEFGINSTDYLSEYDDLIAQVKKKFNDYADAVKQNIGDVAQAHADIEALVKQIADNQIVKQTDFENYKNKLGVFDQDDRSDDYFEDELLEVGGSIPSYYVDQLNDIAGSLPKDRFNVGFITDNHYQNFDYSPNGLAHYANIAALSRRVKLAAIISGGDNINGDNNKRSKVWQTKHVMAALKYRVSNQTDVFALFGNHDSGIGQTSDTGTTDLTIANNLNENELKALYGTNSNDYGETRNGNSLYGLKDYVDKKVRVVFLNAFDLPWTSKNGVYDYDFLSQSGFQNEQLNWLANTAFKLPDSTWQVMIFSHAPLSGSFGYDKNGEGIKQFNTDALVGLINALQNGSSYTLQDSKRELPVDITANFTSQGSIKVIGFISGHIHQDDQMVFRSINCIETTCSWATLLNDQRVANTITEDAWDVFSVDTTNHHIYIKRFGYGDDRDFTY